MKRFSYPIYCLLLALVFPMQAFAEGDTVHPPGSVGFFMVALSLILPAIAYFWMRSKP